MTNAVYNIIFDSIAEFFASNGEPRGVGAIWHVKGGVSYEELDPARTDEHVMNAAGVKFQYIPTKTVLVEALGGVVDTLDSQLEVLRTAFTLAEVKGLSVTPQEGAYYVETNGIATRIALKRFPTVIGTLRLKWESLGGTSNRIMTVDATEGLLPIAVVSGAPPVVKGQRVLNIGAGLDLSVGDWIAIRAGEDITDPNQPGLAQVSQVSEYDAVTGELTWTDGARIEVNYGANDEFRVTKLDVEPVGGVMSLDVDQSVMTYLSVMPLKVSYATGWYMPTVDMNEADFGLTIADGSTDWRIGNYNTSFSRTQEATRQPRMAIDIYSCGRGVIENTIINSDNVLPIAGFIHGESSAQDIEFQNVHFNAWFDSPRVYTDSIVNIDANTKYDIGNFYYNCNQNMRLKLESNPAGGEVLRVQNLIIKDKGTHFEPADVLGTIVDEGNNGPSGAPYEIGPLQEFEYIFDHLGNGGHALLLGNILVQEVAVYCADLTSTLSLQLQCVENTSIAQNLDRTADSQWVRTKFPTPQVLWFFEPGGAFVNRLDLTDKRIFMIHTSGPTQFRFKVLGRKVDGDQF